MMELLVSVSFNYSNLITVVCFEICLYLFPVHYLMLICSFYTIDMSSHNSPDGYYAGNVTAIIGK